MGRRAGAAAAGAVAAVLILTIQAWSAELLVNRRVVNFNQGWRFAKGSREGAEQPAFDDSAWQAVQLPHDWAISGPFSPREDGYAGKLPWKGQGWYRKTFTLNNWWRSRVYLDFDGVMAFPKVYVNGQPAGQWDYGYMSFRVDATPYVKFGQSNTVAVYVDTRSHGTRWYPGAGICRKVTMTICNPVHVAHWGTFVTTPSVEDVSATIRVRSTVENHLESDSRVRVFTTLRDPAGLVIATSEKSDILLIPPGESNQLDRSFTIANPQRWDLNNPSLYSVSVDVRADGSGVDTVTIPFGIRTFEFTANDGFHLNGRRVQLHGVNLHHDQGPLGAAFYPRAMERQLEIMRDMGVNAVRTSHNPPAPELLDLCDRMGMVVWDEAFDKWDGTADRIDGQPPLEEYGEKQIRNFVMRDRNHPSVVVWSVGNEINPGGRDGVTPERVKFMSDFVRKYDPTRPVGMGCHIPEMANTPDFDALDLTGWNYLARYSIYRKRYPNNPIIYSESASALSTRGFYDLDFPGRKNIYSDEERQVSSYDLTAASWSDIPDAEFKLMTDDSFVAGEFVWTGFDYLGEPTPFSREAKSSYFGIVDLCGIPKDRFYLYRSYWRPDVTTVHILPHWNWPDRVGQNVPVFVYTNGDSAELFLNGRSLGRRQKGVVPVGPPDLARGRPATAGSSQPDHPPEDATDDNSESRWCAANAEANQWWQVDLGEVHPIRYLEIDFEGAEKNYGYEVKVSPDGVTWQTAAGKSTSRFPQWTGPSLAFHTADARGRYLRIEFNQLQDRAWASIRKVKVYPEKAESDYYAVTYAYRLRWNEVTYEPGELKAVAYKDGQQIGEAVMRTAGDPAAIRLTPDRTELAASGEDLCYVLVEALDDKGTLCPLAENLVRFKVDAPAEIAGVGNGNPLSIEPFQADYRKLFHGKAMLILRTKQGQAGRIRIAAESDGLTAGQAVVQSRQL
jgi:beta-galactosidase